MNSTYLGKMTEMAKHMNENPYRWEGVQPMKTYKPKVFSIEYDDFSSQYFQIFQEKTDE